MKSSNRYLGISLLILLVFTVLILFYTKGRKAVLIHLPGNKEVVEIDDKGEYRFPGDTVHLFYLHKLYDDKAFSDNKHPRYLRTDCMKITMESDYKQLASIISAYTDDIGIHDVPFNVHLRYLEPIRWSYTRGILEREFEFSSWRAKKKIKYRLRNMKDNIRELSEAIFAKKTQNLDFFPYGVNHSSFRYAYVDKASGVKALIESLPYAESDLEIYYYPTIYFQEKNSGIVNSHVINDDDDGTLFKLTDPLMPKYLYYFRIGPNQYSRILSDKPILGLDYNMNYSQSNYFEISNKLNRTIRSNDTNDLFDD